MTSHQTSRGADLSAMRRALHLATLSPRANKNPRVGCVLVNNEGDIVAEGYHLGAGNPHAEVEALRACEASGISPAGLTAVVTLEPCNHQGLTPPCTKALIAAGIGRVVYGASDPGEPSSGGAEALESAGISVTGGVLAEESESLNTHWFFAIRHGRPFVTAKWAQSLDGRHAAKDLTSQWITGPISRERVHRERSEHGAIVVGSNTAVVDNPALTARDGDGSLHPSQPLAVVVGQRDLPADLAVRNHPGGFHHMRTHDPREVVDELYAHGVRSIYLEGGATLTSAFIAADLVDECHITMGPLLIGGPHTALTDIGVDTLTDAKPLHVESVEHLGEDIWVVATPQRSFDKEGA